MYYQEVPVTTKPEKDGWYGFYRHSGSVLYPDLWLFNCGHWYSSKAVAEQHTNPQSMEGRYAFYLRPVEPSPDVEAAARELESNFDNCYDKCTHTTHGGYGSDVIDRQELFKEFLPFINQYALAKCREAEERVKAVDGESIYDWLDKQLGLLPTNGYQVKDLDAIKDKCLKYTVGKYLDCHKSGSI